VLLVGIYLILWSVQVAGSWYDFFQLRVNVHGWCLKLNRAEVVLHIMPQAEIEE
jgi:hypothetical protein